MVLHHDEKEASRSPDDILVRRLKNRERQRRYRARKRQEADLRKASGVDQSSLHFQQKHTGFLSVPLEVEISVSGTPPDYLTRIHCQRDWKKDARSAHMHKKQQTCSLENGGTVISAENSATFVDGGHQDSLLSNQSNTTVQDNTETRALQSSRRHWKEEARNKRNSE